MELREIVKTWLAKNGYDGLVEEDYECACILSDLMPCNKPGVSCLAGHEEIANPESGYDFIVKPGKA